MNQKISKFDIFGQPFAFNAHKSSATYTTVTGGLITIIWVALVSVVSYVIFAEYLDTTKPVVSVNRIRREKPALIDFNKYKTGLANILFDGKRFLTFEESKKYFTFGGKYIKRYKKGTRIAEEIKQRKIFNCFEEDVFKSAAKELTQVDSKINYTAIFSDSMICVNLNKTQLQIEGDKTHLPFTWNTIDIYPCSLPNPRQCASPQELSAVQVGFVNMVKVAKYRDKKEPLETALDVDSFFYVDIASKSLMKMFQKINYIYDDSIGLVGERLVHTFVDSDKIKVVTGTRYTRSIYCSQQQIEDGQCEPYMEVAQRSSNEKMVIQRRYKMLFGVVSEIGGFNDLIIITLWSCYTIYNTYSYRRLIRFQMRCLLAQFKQEPRNKKDHLSLNLHYRNKVKTEKQSTKILKTTSNSIPLPGFELLVRTNSQAAVFLEMVFLRFQALEIFIS